MPALLDDVRYRLGTWRQMRREAHALRKAAGRATSPDEVVAAAFATADAPVSITPVQVPTELARLVEFIAAERPRRVLEVGTGRGGTLFGIAWASAPGAQILSLELKLYPTQRRGLYSTFVGGRQVEVWETDSHLEEARDRVAAHFGHEPLDLLFIDGDHTYDGVSRDYELYAPLVRDGGVIAFHDIVDGPYEAVGDAPRFWREVRQELEPAVELVDSWDQGGYGIGIGRRHGERPATPTPSGEELVETERLGVAVDDAGQMRK
jgi:predicted O-methyltransferase YrrM